MEVAEAGSPVPERETKMCRKGKRKKTLLSR